MAAISLLRPDTGPQGKYFKINETTKEDLELNILFRQFASSEREYIQLTSIIENISLEPDEIKYRQDIFEDFYNNEALFNCFTDLTLYLEILTSIIQNKSINELVILKLQTEWRNYKVI